MRNRVAAVLVVLAVLAGACGDDDDDGGGVIPSDTTTEKSSGPQTFPIRVDAKSEPFAVSWIAFFPSKVTARPGDTLEFTAEFTGAAHTVMGGTLVDELAKAEREAVKKDPNGEGPPPREVEALQQKIPSTFAEEIEPDSEILVQAGNQPCFSKTDDPPTTEPCPEKTQPDTFTGEERFFNSGFMEDEDTFKIKLDDTIDPGTYIFACAVHFSHMSEEVTVVSKGTEVPSADDVNAAGDKELGDLMAKAKPDADKVTRATDPKNASAGAFPEDESVPTDGINVFPAELAIKKGEAVTWTINGFHTVAFNAPEGAQPWILKADDGSVSTNKKTFAPANSPKIPQPPPPAGGVGEGGPAEEGPPPEVKVNGGRYDGKGFLNSGVLLAETRADFVYTLTFTEAGTFNYVCLVHPNMEGTVKVT